MTPEEKKLSEAVNFYIKHSIIDIDGETMTLGDAIRKLRGGDHTVTKWRKCSEQQPKTPREGLVIQDGQIMVAYWNGYEWQAVYMTYLVELHPTHWQNLPLKPKPEKEDERNDA